MKTINYNVRKLSREYSNLQRQLDEGQRVRVRQGNKRVYMNLSWNVSQRTLKEERAKYLLRLLANNKIVYKSEQIKEPAIATYDENNQFRYVPLSQTGMSIKQLQERKA